MTVSFFSWEQFRVARFGNGLYDYVFSILIILNLNWNMRTNLPLNNSLLVSTVCTLVFKIKILNFSSRILSYCENVKMFVFTSSKTKQDKG